MEWWTVTLGQEVVRKSVGFSPTSNDSRLREIWENDECAMSYWRSKYCHRECDYFDKVSDSLDQRGAADEDDP